MSLRRVVQLANGGLSAQLALMIAAVFVVGS